MKKEMVKSKTFNLVLLLSAFMVTAATAAVPETEGNEIAANIKARHRVLVVGMNDNVISNYFTKDMLAEGTGISEDSICAVYNNVIESGLVATTRKERSAFDFVASTGMSDGWTAITKLVRIEGEDGKAAADLSTVNVDKLRNLLEEANAAYLLVLDAHYMKYQESPFKTLFHYVNYSLYDAGKRKLAQGSNYFTSINPQSRMQMMKSSRKSAEKIVEMVENTLD